ncbi:unnamed protein product [Paramecium pentaurelia]|uniref:Uncharacterized protein n=1 Tax=Paramecium pentaurelia TaxID=43138 RepID=A0A8S1X793_9CILI|nr:unnamed protein product [Paramecium pentaurelia]
MKFQVLEERVFEKQRLEFGSRKLVATIDPHQQSEALLRNQGLLSYKFEQFAQFKKGLLVRKDIKEVLRQNPIIKQILKVKNLKGFKRKN